MSKLLKQFSPKGKIALVANEKEDMPREDIEFTIQDTEYLLRKLVEAQIDGREVEQASDVMKKVKELHTRCMEQSVAVNSG